MYEEKMRKLRQELKKLQEVNLASEDEVKYDIPKFSGHVFCTSYCVNLIPKLFLQIPQA